MSWLAVAWDYLTFLVVILAMTVGGIAIHKPDLIAQAVVTAYPDDLPPMSEDELFVTMDKRVWP